MATSCHRKVAGAHCYANSCGRCRPWPCMALGCRRGTNSPAACETRISVLYASGACGVGDDQRGGYERLSRKLGAMACRASSFVACAPTSITSHIRKQQRPKTAARPSTGTPILHANHSLHPHACINNPIELFRPTALRADCTPGEASCDPQKKEHGNVILGIQLALHPRSTCARLVHKNL